MTFTDPILGGESKLIRSAIQSPNYVPGVSGWSINRDGTAEFNDVTARGVIRVDGDNGGYVEINKYAQFAGIELMPEFPFTGEEPGRLFAYNEVSGNPWPITALLSPGPPASPVSRINLFGEREDGTLPPKIQLRDGDTEITEDLTVAGTAAVSGLLTGGVPYCRVAKIAAQTLANNTITAITFTSEIEDDRNWHNNGVNPSRITPDLPGRYLVIGNLTYAANATGDRRGYILKNGATSGRWSRVYPAGAVQTQTTVTSVVTMNGTTDYIEIGGLQSSGGNLDMSFGAGDGDTTFSCTFEVIYQGSIP